MCACPRRDRVQSLTRCDAVRACPAAIRKKGRSRGRRGDGVTGPCAYVSAIRCNKEARQLVLYSSVCSSSKCSRAFLQSSRRRGHHRARRRDTSNRRRSPAFGSNNPSDAASARPRPPLLLAAGGVLRLQPFHRGPPAAARHQSAAEDGRAGVRPRHLLQPRTLRLGLQRGGRRVQGRAPVLPLRPRPRRGGHEL